MGEAPDIVPCCHESARRVYGNFQFQEDRYRFFHNHIDGGKFSFSLGIEHPDNRKDYHAITQAIGCEPMTAKTRPAKIQESIDYQKHVATGGERVKSFEQEANPRHDEPKPPTVLEQLRASNMKISP